MAEKKNNEEKVSKKQKESKNLKEEKVEKVKKTSKDIHKKTVKKKKDKESRSIKITYDDVSKWKTIATVFCLLFFLTCFLYIRATKRFEANMKLYASANSGISGSFAGAPGKNAVYFIATRACSKCGSIQPTIEKLANLLNASYRKVNFIRPVPFPGAVIIYNNTIVMFAFRTKTDLLNYACMATKNKKVCNYYKELEEEGANKTKEPIVKFFVMAFCPFGQQMEKVMAPVYEQLKGYVRWQPNFIVEATTKNPTNLSDFISLHGKAELYEDVRQLCIIELYGVDKWWDYVIKFDNECTPSSNITAVEKCSYKIAKSIGIDVNKIQDCVQTQGVELLKKELSLIKQYSVTGSPTVFINNNLYQGERTPQAFKEAVCMRFTNPPTICNESINATTSTTPQGTCG